MKTLLRSAAGQFPLLANAAWRFAYPAFRRPERCDGADYGDDRQETFETIFVENRWQSDESRSGDGSTLDQTKILRGRLPRLMRSLEAKTLLDAPCGDFNWMQAVKFAEGITYIGGEIVPVLVDNLNALHQRPGREFVQLDIVSDPLPDADVWLCRDVLFHLSAAEIRTALENFVRSNIRYLLTTTYDFVTENADIRSGGFRFINLRLAPFNFGPPRQTIDDFLAPEPPRRLGLWTREDVASALARAS